MSKRYGDYFIKPVYYHHKKHWLVAKVKGDYKYHTHIYGDNINAAILIAKRAAQKKIPDGYPDWMIESINRLWYGKGTKKRDLIYNDIL